MRTLYVLAFAVSVAATCALPASASRRSGGYGGPQAATVAVVQMPGGANVQGGAQAAVAELGTVSAGIRATASGVSIVRHARSYVVVTAIGLRASSTGATGTVSLQAFLDSTTPGLLIKIDGVPIGEFPVTFAGHVPVGLVTRHRIEVEIPNNLDPARIPSEIPLEFGATPQ